jgi:hypothetical protein
MTLRAGAGRFILIAASLVVVWRPPAVTAADLGAAAESFLAASRRLNDGLNAAELKSVVSGMERALTSDPRDLTSILESSVGGDAAVRRYANAMMDAGRSEALGRQLSVILRGGDPGADIRSALSKSVPQDGSVWFDNAEDAGFFAGAIAWALERQSDPRSVAEGLAAGLRVSVALPSGPSSANRSRRESWSAWLREAMFPSVTRAGATRPSAPALHTFDAAFRRVAGAE